jgi:hypothetical protein
MFFIISKGWISSLENVDGIVRWLVMIINIVSRVESMLYWRKNR